jgi:hypothetical protein
MPKRSFSAETDDLAITTVTRLIKLDEAEEINLVKQDDKSWLIEAELPD